MSHKKAGGSTRLGRDSNAQRLGVKTHDGESINQGSIIVRQRGTRIAAGAGVKMGKDHTLYAAKEGVVKFGEKRKTNFNGKTKKLKTVSVI